MVLDDRKGVAGSRQPEPSPVPLRKECQTRVLWYLEIQIQTLPFGLFGAGGENGDVTSLLRLGAGALAGGIYTFQLGRLLATWGHSSLKCG